MAYIKQFQNVWRHEIEQHFKTISECGRQCEIKRENLYKSFYPNTGYISDSSFLDICKKMDLSPLCFIDGKYHDYYYNDHYKMTYKEFTALAYRQKHVDCDLIEHILKICAGLTDQDIEQIDKLTLLKLNLDIHKRIYETLHEKLPNLY